MRFLFAIIGALLPGIIFAQYNDSTHYYTGLASTGTVNTTNTSSSYVFSNILKAGIRKKDISLNLATSWLYGEEQKKLTNNDYTSTLDFDLYKTLPHFYYWGLGNYTTSYSLKINNQYQGGLGVAYNIIDRKNARLNLSDGILYEASDIYVHDTERQSYTTFRNSLRLSFRFVLWDLLSISHTSFYQNSLSNGNDYIIRSNSEVSIKVRKWFSFTTSFIYNRFNRTEKENSTFNYGITLEKYF